MRSQLSSFEVGTKGYDGRRVIAARTAGQAKAIHWRDVAECGVHYTDVRARRVSGALVDPPGFRNCATTRGFPWVKIGQRVHVSRYWGNIVGHNGSANWNVLVDGGSLILNCHPRSEITYYDEAGKVIESYNIRGELVAAAAAAAGGAT